MAAAYYAATLTPDPTLQADPDPQALAAYRGTGERLASALLKPERVTVIRCVSATRDAHPDRFSKALARVHDRHLLIILDYRGVPDIGGRVLVHNLIDLPMASREGHRATLVPCECGSIHQLPFRWLRHARPNEVSDRRSPIPPGPPPDPDSPERDLPPDGAPSIANQAFITTTGALTPRGTLFWCLPLWRAICWREHFGLEPPYDQHLERLVGTHQPIGDLEEGPTLLRGFPWVRPLPAGIPARIRRVLEAHR